MDVATKADALTNLGCMHERRNELKKAAKFLRGALKQSPQHVIALRHLIDVLLWDEDEAGADRVARKVFTKDSCCEFLK